MTRMATSEGRAYQVFKSLLDLDADEVGAALDRLASTEPEVHTQVALLIARDRKSDLLLDRLGAGADELLAADLLTSMMARGELDADAVPERIGPYRLLGELGRGGMGVVYEAEQDTPRRRVAIKTAHAWLRTPELAERFRFEVQAMASLRHRAIPRLFEVREEGGTTWMVMELVRGEPLDLYAARLPLDQRLRLLIEIADGVSHAHAAGIAHRDLKPANIVVSEGHPRILDFGLASALDQASQGAGTLAYMAPEVLEGGDADHRADLYGLGVILYELVSGERPPSSRGETRAELRANKALMPPRLGGRRGLPRDLDFILARALHPDPAQRYASAQAFASDLEATLAGRPVSARKATLFYRLQRALGRQRRPLLAVGLTLLLAGLIVGALALLRARDEAAARVDREHVAEERLTVLMARDAELRRRGETAEAEALFSYFVRAPDHAGTRALHEAWLWWGRTMRALTEPRATLEPLEPRFGEASREAFAEAYANATDEDGRVTALLELGRLFQRWEGFDGVRRVLELLSSTSARRPEVDALRFTSTLETRSLELAATLDHDRARDLAPVLLRLAQGSRLGFITTAAGQMAASPDRPAPIGGTPLIGVLDQPSKRLSVLDKDLRVVARLELPTNTRFGRDLPHLLRGMEQCVVVPLETAHLRLYCLDDTASPPTFRELVELPIGDLHVAIGWVGPDGPEALFGTAAGDRALYHWSRDGLVRVPPEVVGPASDVDALLRADLDGDGEPEIIAAFGAWRAYDLRVLRQTRQAQGGFVVRARKRLGVVHQLGLLHQEAGPPLLALTKHDAYPNPLVFGEASPFGVRAGVYLFELSGDTLRERALIPYLSDTRLEPTPHRFVIGDFDGDGLEDLALGCASSQGEYTALYRQTRPLHFVGALIGGMTPLGALDLGTHQGLLVRTLEDLQGWVLGSGNTPLPPRPSTDPPRDEPAPPDTDLALEWQRASELDSMGLPAIAARRVEAAARLARAPHAGQLALIRAAELLTKAGHSAEATDLLDEILGNHPSVDVAHLAYRERARAHLERFALSAAVADLAKTPLDIEGGHAWIEAVATRTSPATVVIADGLLDPRWRTPRVGAITRTGYAARSLRLSGARGDGVIASLPVSYPGGAITIDLSLTVEHLELGVLLALRLRQGEREVMRFELFGQGGGLVLNRLVACAPSQGLSASADLQPFRSDLAHERLTIRLGLMPKPGGNELLCEIANDQRPLVARRNPIAAPAEGASTLELVASGEAGGAAALWSARIDRLSIAGLAPTPTSLTPSLTDAREALHTHVASSPWDAADHAVDLGDAAEALLVLTDAAHDTDFWSSHELMRRLRLAPATWLPIVSGLDRPLALSALTSAWAVGVRYLSSESTLAFLRLPALSEIGASSEEDRLVLAALLRAGLRFGLTTPAWRHALDLAELTPATATTSELALLAAAHYARQGDEARARALFARWRDSVPFPDLAFESLPHDPDAGHLATWLE